MKDPAQVAQSLGITPAAVQLRLAAVGLTPQDRESLRAAAPASAARAGEFLDSLYARLREQPETGAHLRNDAQIERLKVQQRAYLHELFTADVDWEYAMRLLRIGVVHHQVRLAPQWYLATYAYFVCDHLDAFFAPGADPAFAHAQVQALFKSVCFDASLVLDAYGRSRETDLWAELQERSGHSVGSPAAPEFSATRPGRSREESASVYARIPLTRENTIERRRFVGLTDDDVERLRALGPIVQRQMPEILREFYDFLAATPDMAALVPPATAERLIRQVNSYWTEFCEATFDRPYAASRMRIGVIHEKIGVGPEWYLAGLARQCTGLLRAIAAERPDDVALVRALVRALFFDMSFVLDAYMEARADSLLRTDGFAAQLVAGLASAVCVFDGRDRLVSANSMLVSLVGADPAVLYLMPVESVLPLPGAAELVRSVRGFGGSGGSGADGAGGTVAAEGAGGGGRRVAAGTLGARRLRMTAMALTGEHSPAGSVALVLDDVTDVLKLGADLEQRQGHYEQLADAAGAVLWEFDAETGTISAINHAALEMTGLRDVAFLGRAHAWTERVADADRPRFLARIQALRPGQQDDVEYRFTHADGSERWLRTRVGRPGDAADARVMGVTLDVTAARRAEGLRLEGIATIAGGVAHTVNNSLMGVLGNIEMFVNQSRPTDAGGHLQAAVEATRKSQDMAARLLSFAGQQTLRPQPIAVDEVVREGWPRIERQLGAGIAATFEVVGQWEVRADREALLTALECLASNARDAMNGEGAFTVRLRDLSGSTLSPLDEAFGREWVELEVSDSGAGMPAHVRDHAVEPFFTTRSLAESSGLGLSMVHGFLLQSGGHVRLESAPGRGTTVLMRFPRFVASDPEPVPETRTLVLLVEDEPEIRRVFATMVRHLGHDVITAGSAEEAHRAVGRHRPSVLLTDIVLGAGGDGIQLASDLTLADPDLAVVLVSGFSPARFDLGSVKFRHQFLAKPFTLQALATCLEAALPGVAGASSPPEVK